MKNNFKFTILFLAFALLVACSKDEDKKDSLPKDLFLKYSWIKPNKVIDGTKVTNDDLTAYEGDYDKKQKVKSLFKGWKIHEFDQNDVRCFGDPDGFFTKKEPDEGKTEEQKNDDFLRWILKETGTIPSIRGSYVSEAQGFDVVTNYKDSDGTNNVGDNTFRIMTRKVENAEGTLLFLNGGGGCIAAHDDPRANPRSTAKPRGIQSCAREASIGGSLLSFLEKAVAPLERGVKNAFTEEKEPNFPDGVLPDIKKKNIVFVPACDGSIFMGDRRISGEENKYGDEPIHYDGLRAVQAATNLLKKEFPNETDIVIHGASAGAFGIFAAYPSTRIRFPDAKIAIFNDSGLGILDPETKNVNPNGNKEISTNDFFLNPWNVKQLFPKDSEEDRKKAEKQPIYLYDYFLKNDQNLTVGLFSTMYDAVIRGYLTLLQNPYDENDTGKLPKEKWKKYITETTDKIQKEHPKRFTRFFAPGGQHTMLGWKDARKPENEKLAKDFINWLQNVYKGDIEKAKDTREWQDSEE